MPITPAEGAAALDEFLADQHELGFVVEDICFNTSAEPLKKASKRRAFKCGTFPVTVRFDEYVGIFLAREEGKKRRKSGRGPDVFIMRRRARGHQLRRSCARLSMVTDSRQVWDMFEVLCEKLGTIDDAWDMARIA